MKVITWEQYNKDKAEFISRHCGSGYKEESEIAEETVRQTLVFKDGATWTETLSPIYKTIEDEVQGVKITARAKLYRTEIQDSEGGESRLLYEGK